MPNFYQKLSFLSISKVLLLVGFLATFLYFPLINAYFQQDEWSAFGHYFSVSQQGSGHMLRLAFAPNIGHFTPFYYLAFYGLMSLFGSSYSAFFLTSLFWHLAIYALLFVFIKYLSKSPLIALVVASMFVLSASAHQATSWVVADTNTHGATFFGILSLYFAAKYFYQRKNLKTLWLSIALVFISLFFKEVTIGLFLSIMTLILLLNKRQEINRQMLALPIISGAAYVLLRVVMILLPQSANTASLVTQSQSIGLLIYNILTFPAKAFFQAFLPSAAWVQLGRFIGKVLPHYWASNTAQFATYVNERILEGVFILGFILVLVFTYKKFKREQTFLSRLMIWSLLFVAANSVIYAFSPERSGIITFIDSRNLYFTSIGSFLWLGALLYKRLANHNWIAYSVLIVYFVLQIFYLNTEFKALAKTGTMRKMIIGQVHEKIPALPSNAVFLVTSDTTYYGLPDEQTTPPFQSGFGHTLLVSFTNDHHYPSDFYDNTFLWPITSEGYLSENGLQYGYYQKYSSLLEASRKYKIIPENIYAFSWRENIESMVDITDETRMMLKTNLLQ